MSASPVFYEESQGFAPWAYVLIGVLLLILAGVLTLRMQTTVTPDTLTVRYGLLGSTRVPLREMARAEAVVYRPIREYGGWGLRGFGSRRAINARGDRGVLIRRLDGSTLLVGSQQPRRLLAALAGAGVATEDKLPVEVREF
jgi:hypothetical protein